MLDRPEEDIVLADWGPPGKAEMQQKGQLKK